MGQVYNITNYISFQELNTSNFYFTPFAIFLKQEPGRSALSTMKLSFLLMVSVSESMNPEQ